MTLKDTQEFNELIAPHIERLERRIEANENYVKILEKILKDNCIDIVEGIKRQLEKTTHELERKVIKSQNQYCDNRIKTFESRVEKAMKQLDMIDYFS